VLPTPSADRASWAQGAARADGAAVLAAAAKLASDFGRDRRLERFCGAAHRGLAVGALDIGFVPTPGGLTSPANDRGRFARRALLLGADEIDTADGTFVVYIGTHGDRGAHRADVILPGAAYTEKSGTFVNTEGRVQRRMAGVPAGRGARGLGILRAPATCSATSCPYDSLARCASAWSR
jgi:NADH-quinone oxidoreductase subunit G